MTTWKFWNKEKEYASVEDWLLNGEWTFTHVIDDRFYRIFNKRGKHVVTLQTFIASTDFIDRTVADTIIEKCNMRMLAVERAEAYKLCI